MARVETVVVPKPEFDFLKAELERLREDIKQITFARADKALKNENVQLRAYRDTAQAELERLREEKARYADLQAGRVAKLEAQLALARENTQTNGQAYEDAMDRITELEAEKEQYDLNVVAWIQAEAEVERLRDTVFQQSDALKAREARIAELEQENAIHSEANGEKNVKLDRYEADIQRLREDMDAAIVLLNNEVIRLRGDNDLLVGRIRQHLDRITELEAEGGSSPSSR